MKREFIEKQDKNGENIRVGDAFEYGDCIYIVSKDEYGYYMRVFENQVQYGVEEEPVYEEIESAEVEDMSFEHAKIIGSIEDSALIRELYLSVEPHLEDSWEDCEGEDVGELEEGFCLFQNSEEEE